MSRRVAAVNMAGAAVIGMASGLFWRFDFWPATATIIAACTVWVWALQRLTR